MQVPIEEVFTKCVGEDYLILNEVNISNGLRTTYLTINNNMDITPVAVVLFIATILLLIYVVYLRRMWIKDSEREKNSKVLREP